LNLKRFAFEKLSLNSFKSQRWRVLMITASGNSHQWRLLKTPACGKVYRWRLFKVTAIGGLPQAVALCGPPVVSPSIYTRDTVSKIF
jgi:hypothetical protein